MAFLVYSSLVLFLFLVLVSFIVRFCKHHNNNNSIIPTNWPVFGMLPTILAYGHRLHDYVTQVLAHSGGTFLFKGPWFANMDMLVTTNPLDIHHIMSKNFSNYSRGDKFLKIFDILGDGFSNTDGELWEFQRKTIISVFSQPCFQSLFEKTISNKVENGLMPILDHVAKQGVEIDLHEILQRFSFDTTCTLLFDHDPKSMSLDFPYIPFEKAFSKIEEAIFHRYITPPSFWKLQQWLRVGYEKNLSDAWKVVDRFIYDCLARTQKELTNMTHELNDKNFKLSLALMKEFKDQTGISGDPNKFLRDNFLNLMIAGRDSTGIILSWFFYLLAQNPTVEDKIREELHAKLDTLLENRPNATKPVVTTCCVAKNDISSSDKDKIREELHMKLDTLLENRPDATKPVVTQQTCCVAKNDISSSDTVVGVNWKRFNTKDLRKLTYLHGALCEALRLFPSVPFQNKTPLLGDILPSGHQVDHNTTIILSYYTMGRMKSIWGDDCLEFKPERWVLKDGVGIKHEPSYKFPAFNVGPRTCLGKEISFSHMKMVAASIIYHYHVELVNGHEVAPCNSILLKMKNGLKVRLIKQREVKL